MALFIMILRKMVRNRWLELSLLLGLIVSVALASTMPIYTQAILQRLLIKDLENLQKNTGLFPGTHSTSYYVTVDTSLEAVEQELHDLDAYQEWSNHNFGIPLLLYVKERSSDTFPMVPVNPAQADPSEKRIANFVALTDLQSHIRIVDGRMPAVQPVEGVYEALVVEELLDNLNLVLDTVFELQHESLKEPIRIKPVGVIDRKDYSDIYWQFPTSHYQSSFFIDFDLFEEHFTKGHKLLVYASFWHRYLDYTQMKLASIEPFVTTASELSGLNPIVPALQTIDAYIDKEKQLKLMLWSLNVPLMIMIAFYLFMVSNLIAERQKTEIAVLRSRGASRLQIVSSYLVEGVLLGGVAFALGPLLGMQLTKLLGASNGFLEFVQRAAIDVELSKESYQYALAAVIASVLMTLIPVLHATRVSIVGHKQTLARQQRVSFLHKTFIDVILLGVSFYLLQSFHRRMDDLVSLGLQSTDLKIDPLLFLVPALFMLSMGLLLLRIYPWLIQFIYWLGRRWWPPYLYSGLLQVGRSATQYQFIMLFLILTMATGLFSASAARTMNQNIEDKLLYKNGADIVLQTEWENDAPPPQADRSVDTQQEGAAIGAPSKVQYTEPPFLRFFQLPGVEAAARVFSKADASFSAGRESAITHLMGIDTDEFGRTTSLRESLLDHHFYEYLNLIASNPRAVLISRSIAEQYKVREGDTLQVRWKDVEAAPFIVFGIIDYWPSWNPNPLPAQSTSSTAATSKDSKVKLPNLIVGHLSYMQNNMALEPYEVWLKMSPDASSQELYDALQQKNFNINYLKDHKQELIRAKNDPFQLAINGVMTLGFLIGIGISFMGFLLYWILSLTSRIVQFGVLRAMGVSFKQIIGMLAVEQLLTSGAAVLIGVATGQVASRLFISFFQLAFDPRTQVPPFQVISHFMDRMNLYMTVSFMILLGLLIIGILLSRIKIHQAVKLGED